MSIIKIYSDQSRRVDWTVRQKTDATLTLTVTLSSAAFNLSSYTFIAELFEVGGTTAILTLTQGNGITNGGAAGTILLSITDTQLNLDADEYFWKLRTTAPTDNLWLNGAFKVNDYVWDGSTNSSATIALTIGGDNLSLALTIAGSSSGVTTFNTRSGAVVPLTGDYAAFYDALGAAAAAQSAAATDATTKANAAQAASQPLDSDLTAIAALTTTSYGRALLTLANAAAADWKEKVTTATALTDAATIDITGTHHTLATASSRTFTISFTGDSIKLAITLSATSATFTLPSGHKGIYGGTPSGTNTLVVTGATSGDVILVAIEKIGSVYYWVGKNAIH